MSGEVFNPNPIIFAPTKSTRSLPPGVRLDSLWLDDGENRDEEQDDSNEIEAIDQDEIFGMSGTFALTRCVVRYLILLTELIRSISDPEHRNMSLEQLAVVSAPQITFDARNTDRLTVEFTPTVPHCGMSTFIGAHCLVARYHLG